MLARWQWTALTLGLTVTAAFIGMGWVESHPDWQGYQLEYARLAGGAGTSGRGPEIQQIELPPLHRVDRCTTCHLGATNPAMAGAAEPFATHSPLIESHPPRDFGCTICHGGEGRAVRADEAHGEAPGQRGRLLPAALRASACYTCHGLTNLPPEETVTVAEGIKLVNSLQCLRCHQLDGVGRGSRPRGGSIGPDLSTIGSKRNWVELYAHLLSPAAVVPGSTMPDFGLRRREATAITAFLLTRLDVEERIVDQAYLRSEPSLETPAPAPDRLSAPEALAPDYDRAALFEGLDCPVCHRVGLRGGEVGPALTHIGRARDAAWLRDLLTDPERVLPEGRMPEYDLTEAQVAALVEYLAGLR